MARVLNNIQIAGFEDNNPDSIKYGTSTVHQVYKGSTLVWTRPIFLTLAAGKNCTTSWSLTYPDGTTETITTPQTLTVGYGTKLVTTCTANSGYYFNDDQTQTTWTDSDTVTSPYTDQGSSAYKVITMPLTLDIISNGKFTNIDGVLAEINDGYMSYQYEKQNGVIESNDTPFGYLNESLEVPVSGQDWTWIFRPNPDYTRLYYRLTASNFENKEVIEGVYDISDYTYAYNMRYIEDENLYIKFENIAFGNNSGGNNYKIYIAPTDGGIECATQFDVEMYIKYSGSDMYDEGYVGISPDDYGAFSYVKTLKLKINSLKLRDYS